MVNIFNLLPFILVGMVALVIITGLLLQLKHWVGLLLMTATVTSMVTHGYTSSAVMLYIVYIITCTIYLIFKELHNGETDNKTNT